MNRRESEAYDVGYESGYTAARRDLTESFRIALVDIANTHIPALLGKYKDSAEFLFELESAIDMETGEQVGSRPRAYGYKTTALRMEIRPTVRAVVELGAKDE